MQFKKSSLALAVAACLVVGNANAIVAVPNTAANPAVKFSSELLQANAGLANAGANLDLAGAIGWGVAANNHLYIRIELTNGLFRTALAAGNLTLNTLPVGGVLIATGAVVVSTGGAAGSSFVVFDVTNTVAPGLTTANGFQLTPPAAALTYVNPAQPMAVTAKFYTDSTLAATGGTALATSSGSYVVGTPALATSFTPDTSIATVVSGYKLFAGNATTAPALAAGKVAHIGTVSTALDATVIDPATGIGVIPAALAANSTLVVSGLFSAVGASGSIGISPGAATCAAPAAGTLNADKTTATFTGIGTASLVGAVAPFGAAPWSVCYTADGVTEIPTQTVTGVLTFTGVVAPSVPAASGTVGTIKRDGTQLVAPLVQVPPTASPTRLVLNNTNSTDQTYAVTPLAETGVTVALTGAAAGGTVKAGETKVIDLGGLVTITGSTSGALRTGLKVTSPAPAGTMTGYYILLNSNGVVSNFLLNPVE